MRQNKFLIALSQDDIKQAKQFLELGVDITSNLDEVASPLRTALIVNPKNNFWYCAALLLDKDVDPCVCCKDRGRTSPLHLMAQEINPERVHILDAIIDYEVRNNVKLIQYLRDNLR